MLSNRALVDCRRKREAGLSAAEAGLRGESGPSTPAPSSLPEPANEETGWLLVRDAGLPMPPLT